MTYTGTVLHNNQPLPGVGVFVFNAITGNPTGQVFVTNNQGQWSADLTGSDYILHFYLDGYKSYQFPVTAANGKAFNMQEGTGYEPAPGEMLPTLFTVSNKKGLMIAGALLLAFLIYKAE